MADTEGVRRGPDAGTQAGDLDRGSSLIEQMIAMLVIAGALLGLLSTLGATATGIVAGRQRTLAISLAKQVIENLQGAAYKNVAIDKATLAADPLILGADPNQTFESEKLVVANAAVDMTPAPYRTLPVAVGTTFSIRTFVTTAAAGYRRITVIVDWPSVAPKHTLRFSSYAYEVVNTSYPASNGSATVTGARISLDGCLGGDAFDDVHVDLPEARGDTSASTLRSAIGGAGSATSHLEVHSRTDPSNCTTETATDVRECPRTTISSVADNDSSTSIGNTTPATNKTFVACSLTTSGGVTLVSPTGTLTSHSKTDACTSCTWSNPTDAVPWADAQVATGTGSSATFTSGGLVGTLWTMGNVWSAATSVDHDATGSGIVKSSATLSAPSLSVLKIPGGLATDGAVKVNAFVATASAQAGYTTAPAAPASTATTVKIWDGTSYRTVSWVPGTTLNQTATAVPIVVGSRQVSFTTTVQAQTATFVPAGADPRTDAAAENPSVLRVTVVVTVSPSTLAPATTTTTPVTTTTLTPPPAASETFTIVVDYGQVSANSTWLAKAA